MSEGSRGAGTAKAFSWLLVVAILAWQASVLFTGPLGDRINWTIDDAFYYLKVAQSVGRGDGSTFDGRHFTNGYHPLWMLLLVPVLRFGPQSPEGGLHAAFALEILLLAGTLLLILRVARRAVPPAAVPLSLLLFAWPRILTQTVSLLESGLLFLLLFALLDRLLARPPGEPGEDNRSRWYTGVLLALVFLARLDTVFLIATIGAAWLLDSRLREKPLALGLLLLPLAALGGGYVAWNLASFGHATPVSGTLKTTFPRPELHLEYLKRYADFALLTALGVGWWVREAMARRVTPVGLFGLASGIHFLFTLVFMKWGVENWHFCPAVPAAAVIVPRLVAGAIDRVSGAGEGAGPRWRRRIAWGAVTLAATGAVGASLAASRDRHRDLLLEHTMEMARWAREGTEPDATFAMTDSGIFAWFSGRTTINTDGLINDFAFVEVLRRGEFADYLAREGVDYYVDQALWGKREVLRGGYVERPYYARLRPEGRDAGKIKLREEDEVYRSVFRARSPVTRQLEENAVIVWRLRPGDLG